MDRSETKDRVRGLMLAAEVIGRPMSPEVAMLYVGDTADIPSDKFQTGLDKARRQCRFMPSPAEFRELACGVACRVLPLQRKSK